MNRVEAQTIPTEHSIPHTRGDEPMRVQPDIQGAYVFPTRVGMNRVVLSMRLRSCSIPHTRGDEPPCGLAGQGVQPYSPHAWG